MYVCSVAYTLDKALYIYRNQKNMGMFIWLGCKTVFCLFSFRALLQIYRKYVVLTSETMPLFSISKYKQKIKLRYLALEQVIPFMNKVLYRFTGFKGRFYNEIPWNMAFINGINTGINGEQLKTLIYQVCM